MKQRVAVPYPSWEFYVLVKDSFNWGIPQFLGIPLSFITHDSHLSLPVFLTIPLTIFLIK